MKIERDSTSEKGWGQFNIFGAVEEKPASDFFSFLLVMLRPKSSCLLRNKTAFFRQSVPYEPNLR